MVLLLVFGATNKNLAQCQSARGRVSVLHARAFRVSYGRAHQCALLVALISPPSSPTLEPYSPAPSTRPYTDPPMLSPTTQAPSSAPTCAPPSALDAVWVVQLCQVFSHAPSAAPFTQPPSWARPRTPTRPVQSGALHFGAHPAHHLHTHGRPSA